MNQVSEVVYEVPEVSAEVQEHFFVSSFDEARSVCDQFDLSIIFKRDDFELVEVWDRTPIGWVTRPKPYVCTCGCQGRVEKKAVGRKGH